MEGDGWVIGVQSHAMTDYFDFSHKIEAEKNIYKKIEYCHEQFELLPFFIKTELELSGEHGLRQLPPFIACREWAPKLYMRLGKWEEAEKFIRDCAAINGYYPEHGEDELNYLHLYKETAEAAIQFLISNPGYLQKDIYKALIPQVKDISVLKNFVRWSLVIEKEPYKKTNRLYVRNIRT